MLWIILVILAWAWSLGHLLALARPGHRIRFVLFTVAEVACFWLFAAILLTMR